MSRYVDLNGVSWDGKPISSKIQEVQTKQGYLQGITVGWLWGDNVPHIDLEKHDKQIRADVIDDFTIKLENAIQEDIDDDVINQWDKGTFMGCVKFVAEQLKAGD